jgi:hypothetical protein
LGNVVAYHLDVSDNPEAAAAKLTNLYDGRTAALDDIRGINTHTAPQLREVIRQITAATIATGPRWS